MNDSGCSVCSEYDTEIEIRGPFQLRAIVEDIQAAIRDGRLSCRAGDPDSDRIGRQAFLELDANGTMPDVIAYRFECIRCGRGYALECETYHGSGGCWRRA